MRAFLCAACVLALVPAFAACDDNPGGGGGGGGSGSTTSTTSSTTTSGTTTSSTTSSSTTTSSTTSSTTTGGGCADPNEPNETISQPAFFNDASQGLSICDTTGLTVSGVLADTADIDWFRGYSLMANGCTPAPTATVSGLSAGADFCFYLQDDAAPTVKSCPAGTTMAQAGNDFTGCCMKAAAGEIARITLTDITDLNATSANTKMAVKLSGSGQACNAYSLNVHF